MSGYLEQLHKKPDHHKRRFALLASATITLFIFGIWSMATFGVSEEVATEKNEVSPFQSLGMNLASSLEAFQDNFRKLKEGISDIYGR